MVSCPNRKRISFHMYHRTIGFLIISDRTDNTGYTNRNPIQQKLCFKAQSYRSLPVNLESASRIGYIFEHTPEPCGCFKLMRIVGIVNHIEKSRLVEFD